MDSGTDPTADLIFNELAGDDGVIGIIQLRLPNGGRSAWAAFTISQNAIDATPTIIAERYLLPAYLAARKELNK